jgi:trans-aconitate 2-methyltransferase
VTLEWDAGTYEAVSGPQTRWGVDFLGTVLGRIPLRGDERVIDAGCGTGRVTGALLERLPRGAVVALDASEAMVEAARSRFAGDDRVRVERQDLTRLEVEEPVDGVFSTATFHWVLDHEALFGRIASALRPGGWLVAQCGGEGNIARTMRVAERVMAETPFREAFEGWGDASKVWHFADPPTTKRRLEDAGFVEVETWSHDEHVEFDFVEEAARFLSSVVLRRHLMALPETERDPFARAVAGGLAAQSAEDRAVVDYVRLNMVARRGGAA